MQENIIDNEELSCLDHELFFHKDFMISSENLFKTRAQTKLLARLHAFSQGQNSIALLTGAIGSGKTTSLNLFTSKCYLPCQLVQDFNKVNSLQKLFSSQLSLADTKQELTAESLLRMLNEATQEFILIIDKAESLPLELLKLLLVTFGQQITGKIKLLLAGESSLLLNANRLIELNDLDIRLVSMNMSPLTWRETKRYLKQCVEPILPARRHLLTKSTIKRIYTLSEGYMGRINRIANQFAVQESGKRSLKYYTDLILCMSILILLGIIGVRVWMLFSENQQQLKPVSLVSPTKASISHAYPVVIFEEANTPSFIASIENQPEERLAFTKDAELDLPLPKSMLGGMAEVKSSENVSISSSQHAPLNEE
jgi:type II secretory pathway predicted ATPase ExeA